MHSLRRLLVKKLIIPMSRSNLGIQPIARSTAVGLAIAFTPTVGVQMPMVFVIWWLIERLFPSYRFNLLIAIAWTWITNVFTLAPIYYLFLVTGRILLGRWDKLAGFDTFQEKLSSSINLDASFIDSFWIYIVELFHKFGLPLWVGSIPWAILFSWLGYRWTISFIQYLQAKREKRADKLKEKSIQP